MARLFISYSRKDEAFARRLATSLSRSGANLWLDVNSIPPGANWSSSIQEGLDIAELMLLILSPDSMASVNVATEWQYFFDEKKPIIPLLLKPTKMHFQLNRLEYIDFHNQGYETALQQLYGDLSRRGIRLSPPTTTTSKPPAQPAHPVNTAPAPRPASQTTTTSPRWGWIAVLVILGVLGAIIIPRLNPEGSAAGSPAVTVRSPSPGTTIGDETLCTDGTASSPANEVTVQVKDAYSTVISQAVTSVDSNRRWKTTVTVPSHTASDGYIFAYTSDSSGAIAQQATIAVKLTDRYLPEQPSLGVIPDDMCQDTDTSALSH